MTINQKIRNIVNRKLKPINDVRHDGIPFGQIQDILKENGLMAIQEDNTEWSGFLCGDNAQADFDLGTWESESQKIKNSMLRLSWYRYASGRYEIIAYIC